METQKVYEKLLVKLDGVGTNNIAVDRQRAVLMINESQNKWVEHILSPVKRDENIRYVQKLLTDKTIIVGPRVSELYDKLPFPDNYFEFSSVIGFASKDNCENVKINLFEIKDQDKDQILQDEFNKPSFLYREAPFVVSDDSLKIYTLSEFKLNKIVLNYYRYPVQIRQVDEEDPESPFNENYQIEFDDKIVDRIISNAVAELQANVKDEAYQLNKQRTIQKL